MRDIHELAVSIAEDALKSGPKVSISLYNYGVSKRELPHLMKMLKADQRFHSVVSTGFMGYVEFEAVHFPHEATKCPYPGDCHSPEEV